MKLVAPHLANRDPRSIGRLGALVAVSVAVTLASIATACGGRADTTSGGAAPASTDPARPVTPAATCEASAAADIEVSSGDLNGFPPYAVSGCTLVYVSAAGDLVLRDLATRGETVIGEAAEHPRRPSVSADLVAWEADEQSQSVVRVRTSVAGVVATRTLAGGFVSAGEPRASGSSVAFTAWNGPTATDDTDVWLYDAKTGDARVVLGGAGQQRFADVSLAYVAATDFSEDPDGRFDNDGKDVSDVIVFERATGAVVQRRLAGKQAFPMLAEDGVLAYLAWTGVHPEPKFVAYQLRSGSINGDPRADRTVAEVFYASTDYARPALASGTLEWIANPDGRTTLYRAPADGSSSPVAVRGLEDFRLFAPSPSAAGFTVLATSRLSSSALVPTLRAVAR